MSEAVNGLFISLEETGEYCFLKETERNLSEQEKIHLYVMHK